MDVSGFIQKYYIDPVTYGTGYNIYNTITYAIILIAAAFLVYKLLKYFQIKIDNRFFFAVLPYIVLGGLLRALEDAGVVAGFLYKTPVIYLLVFVIAIAALFVAIITERLGKVEYYKTWFAIGIVAVIAGLVFVKPVNLYALGIIAAITIAWIIIFFVVKKLGKGYDKLQKFFTKENMFLLNVHMFDASTTFTAIQFYPYFEQHVLPNFLINIFGPIAMFPLKLVIVSLVLYVLDKELCKESEGDLKNFIKFLILILGLAPGLRNLLRLVMGV
jgi:uncharacterized membrane protein